VERLADWYKENNKMDKQKSDSSLVDKIVAPIDTVLDNIPAPVDTALEAFTASLGGMSPIAPALFTIYIARKAGRTMPKKLAPFILAARKEWNNDKLGEFYRDLNRKEEDFLPFPARGTFSDMVDFYQQEGIHRATEEVFERYRKKDIEKSVLLKILRLADENELVQAVGDEYYIVSELYNKGFAKNMDEAITLASALLNVIDAPEGTKVMEYFRSKHNFREADFLNLIEAVKHRRSQGKVSIKNENMRMSNNRGAILSINYNRETIL